MKTLVIGGCGFIGSHVVDSLLDQGIRVRVFDRRPEMFREPLRGVEYVMGDLADHAQVFEAMSGIDTVVHLASATVPATSNLDPVADINGNLVATVQLLELLRSTEVRRIVYLSSGGTVYGIPQTGLVSEDHPLRPISSYGIVKVAIENYLFMEKKLHGLEYAVLRASNPYGPRQGHTGIQGVIGTYLWCLLRGDPIEIWGDGSVVRDFVHVRDLADLCVVALESEVSGHFNAGSGQGASISDIADCMQKIIRKDLHPIYKPGRSYDVPCIVLDMSHTQAELGWTPSIPLEDGIAKTWEWVCKQGVGA